MRKELFRLRIVLDECYEVKGKASIARMLLFHGEVESELFRGTILPGAVDTQRENEAQNVLSARYILEGVDRVGHSCRIFIENTGIDSKDGAELVTTPSIVTDSEELQWLEQAKLEGYIENHEGLQIVICEAV